MTVQKSLDLLGLVVEDKVTNMRGIVSSISFDLFGCIQAIVVPKSKKGGDAMGGRWFDVCRLKIISKNPVMNVPNFEFVESGRPKRKGPAEKPIQREEKPCK